MKSKDITIDLCIKWYDNKEVNPLTGRKIKKKWIYL